MNIRSVRHRGLLRLIEDDDSRELRNDLVRRLRNILAVLITAADMSGVIGPPGWRIHQLKGDRAGTWSISVSGNWRLTFDISHRFYCAVIRCSEPFSFLATANVASTGYNFKLFKKRSVLLLAERGSSVQATVVFLRLRSAMKSAITFGSTCTYR